MLKDPTSWSMEETIEYFRKKFDRDKIQKDIDAGLERTRKFFQQDTPNTTVIHGDNYWATCYREACYLAKYIYRYKGKEVKGKKELNPKYFTEHPEEMAKVEERWELWGNLVNSDSGLVAGLYKQKNYDYKSEKALCPPTLVFRGTDFEDMRGVAILAKIKAIVSTPVITFPFWIRFSYSPEAEEAIKKKEQAGSKSTENNTPIPEQNEHARTGKEETIPVKGWGVGWGRDRNDFKKDGYEEFTIYDKYGAASALIGKIWVVPFYLSAIFSLSLYIYAKKDGDWGNNLKQGLGYESDQYTEAIEYARDIVEEKIADAVDKRLIITGHSLGGGLASAVCCVLAYEYPAFLIQSIVFNAAGVHKNTIKREISGRGEAAKAMANTPCYDICVRDEILTTLGVNYKKLPVLGGVFSMVKREIGQYGLPSPEHISVVTDIKAISPGTAVEMAKNGKVDTSFPPKGAALPILFPLDKQNVVPPPKNGFPIINAIDSLLNTAPDIGMLATLFFEFLNDRYGKEARDNNWHPIDTYKEIFKKFMEEIEPEIDVLMPIMALSNAYHGMDVVIASYENMLVERALRKAQDQQGQQQRAQEQQKALETWQEQERQRKAEEEERARLAEEQARKAEEAQKLSDELAIREAILKRMEHAMNPFGLPLP